MSAHIRVILLACALITTCGRANAMEFFVAFNGGNCFGCAWVAGEGEIDEQTPARFREFVDKNGNPGLIYLNSPGGNLAAGLELGQLLRETDTTVSVGRTIPFDGNDPVYSEVVDGICASACAYAFLGGKQRFFSAGGKLGFHQFYTSGSLEASAESAQAMAGLILMYVIDMGIDPRILSIASLIPPNDILWVPQSQASELNITNDSLESRGWRLEPHRNGLVIHNVYADGANRSYELSIFWRCSKNAPFILVTESSPGYASQITDGQLINFNTPYENISRLHVDDAVYKIDAQAVEFQRLSGDTFYVSIRLPSDFNRLAEANVEFRPDLPRYMGPLISFSTKMPGLKWLNTLKRNCI